MAHEHHHAQRTPEEYAARLESPEREEWQRPDEVVAALALRSSDVVVDIGSGSGYFTRRLARQAAKVIAVDRDAGLLAMCQASSPANVEIMLVANTGCPALGAGSVDMIFLCNVLHHIEARPDYLRQLGRALTPSGRIVNVDFHQRELPIGPPPERKLSAEEVQADFEKVGFVLERSHTFLPYQYFLEFRRTGSGA